MTPEQRVARRAASRRWYQKNRGRARAVGRDRARAERAAVAPTPEEREKARVRAAAWYRANKQRALATGKVWRAKNRDKVVSSRRAWARANKAKMGAYLADYVAGHPDTIRATKRRWKKNNPRAAVIDAHRRRARKRTASGLYTLEQLEARIAYYGGKCAYCPGPFEHVDHVIPLSRGGSNWPANLRPACSKCNCSKNNKTLREWRPRNRPPIGA